MAHVTKRSQVKPSEAMQKSQQPDAIIYNTALAALAKSTWTE